MARDMLDEYAREKRLRSKRPSSIKRRNKGKRTGLLSFEVSEDGKTVKVWNYRAMRGAEKIAIAVIARMEGKLFDTQSGGALAEFEVRNARAAVKLLKLTPVPEECARCQGCGQVDNPIPSKEHPQHDWMNETREEFETRRAAIDAAYDAKYGAGASQKSWYQRIECPSCRGTGRAAQLDSEET